MRKHEVGSGQCRLVRPHDMRTKVIFRHPAEFVGDQADGGGVLAVSGAHWFAALLRRVSGLHIEEDLCQEDWGVVLFAHRNKKKFWIGLNAWDDEGAWLAHFHHRSAPWIRWFDSAGKVELKHLLADVHAVLTTEPAITEIAWHEKSDRNVSGPSYSTPVEN